MSEANIRTGAIAELAALTSLPVYEMGSREDETAGAQIVVQCDRPAVAARDESGRAVEHMYLLIVHLILHSEYQRDNPLVRDAQLAIIDGWLAGLANDDVTGWLDSGTCTGINEQDGTYNFGEAFDDFATVAELYVMVA